MKITIAQDQIEQFIREGLARRVTLVDGEEFAIELNATRGPAGYTCVASVGSDAVTVTQSVDEPIEGEPETLEDPRQQENLEKAASEVAESQDEGEAPTEPETTEEAPEDATESPEEPAEEEAPAPKKRPSIFANMKKPNNQAEDSNED